MKQFLRTFLPVALLASFSTLSVIGNSALADDQTEALKAMIANKGAIRAGRAKAQMCTRCHGRDGIRQLAVRAGWKESDGQFALVKLQAFRDGKLSHQVMSAVSAGLSDQDILQIALWLDSLDQNR